MRHAIVTGASSGIGEAIVKRLLAEGLQVTGLSRREVECGHPNFTSLSVDLSDSVTFSATLNTLPVPQAIVHAAGMMAAAPLGELIRRSALVCGGCISTPPRSCLTTLPRG